MAQYVPAVQGFAIADVLPVAVQKPAVHAVHEAAPAVDIKKPVAQLMHAEAVVAEEPPLPNLPGGQGTGTPVPGQKLPTLQAMQVVAIAVLKKPAAQRVGAAVPAEQKKPAGQGTCMVPPEKEGQ